MAADSISNLRSLIWNINNDVGGRRARLISSFRAAQAAWRASGSVQKSKQHMALTTIRMLMKAYNIEMRKRQDAAAAELNRMASRLLLTDQQALDAIEVSLSEGLSEVDPTAYQRKVPPPERR